MKVQLVIVMAVCCLIQSCQESQTYLEEDLGTQVKSFEPSSEIAEQSVLTRDPGACCNNIWPRWDYNSGEASALHRCPQDEDEETFTHVECGKNWSHYNLIMDQKLDYLACGQTTPEHLRAPDWISSSTSGGYPQISWGFVYSHKYVIERKIGNGAWSVVDSIDNCLYNYYDQGDSIWVDQSILVNSMSVNYYYSVKSQLYQLYSPDTPTVKYTVPVNVQISGPTSITTLQSGTFTTTVTGGLPGYEYEWWKYQECDDPKAPIDPKAPSCGSWVKLSGTASSINVGGVRPSFRLKVVVSDQDDVTDTDIHIVTVTLP